MNSADWADPNARAIAIYLDGSDDPDRAEDGTFLVDDDFLVLVNSWWEPLDFVLPDTRTQARWRVEIDSYSAFLENDHHTPTGLAGYLRERGLQRLFIAGLAYDYCLRFSAIDGKALGFETIVIEDATRAVGLPGSVEATNAAFAAAGVMRITSSRLGR